MRIFSARSGINQQFGKYFGFRRKDGSTVKSHTNNAATRSNTQETHSVTDLAGHLTQQSVLFVTLAVVILAALCLADMQADSLEGDAVT